MPCALENTSMIKVTKYNYMLNFDGKFWAIPSLGT